MFAYLERLRALDEAALAAEAARQKQAGLREPSDVTRLKLAMALILNAQSDESEILVLVEPLARGSRVNDPDLRAMAGFLHAMAIERRRLKDSTTAANARSRDDRRALEAQKQRADQMQERMVQLQEKLDALSNLEKSLTNRTGR